MDEGIFELIDDKPIPRNCAFAFVDILGYKELTKEAYKNNTEQKYLADLRRALSDSQSYFESDLGYEIKTFTDCIIIAWPYEQDSEIALGMTITNMCYLQATMALHGFFVRGAITIGSAYIDNLVQCGDAMIGAYDGESEEAVNPRIIMMDNAKTPMLKHVEFYDEVDTSPHQSQVLIDTDGKLILNYLYAFIEDPDDIEKGARQLMVHKDNIEKCLEKYSDNKRVYSKYQWLARYHDYFCESNPGYFDDSYKIEYNYGHDWVSPPKRLSEVLVEKWK